ncbi:hypothetical protein lerEdw1_012770 [Lerista edwardsae]|nr:hypothetical protein lerEdw1_012770 [Lerista edwardsae]
MQRPLVLLLVLGAAAALEPISVGIAIGAASALTGYLSSPRFYCAFVECCPQEQDRPNGTGTGTGARGACKRGRCRGGSGACKAGGAPQEEPLLQDRCIATGPVRVLERGWCVARRNGNCAKGLEKE